MIYSADTGSLRFRGVIVLVVTLMVLTWTGSVHAAVAADNHEKCSEWADAGECEGNPNYMLVNCATSCDKVMNVDNSDLEGIDSFYQLSAKDIDGNVIPFSAFQGKVVIMTNVASYCGNTQNHYTQLVDLWSELSGSNVEILAFPCNQFGSQEPGTKDEIKAFVQKKGVSFRMMEKINVNGPETSTVYKWLKKVAGPKTITWNFATYYMVSPSGKVSAYNNVEPSSLHNVALSLLKDEL